MPSASAAWATKSSSDLPVAEPSRAFDVHGEVAVAELEPGFAAELAKRLHEVPRFAGSAPPALAIRHAAQRVQHRVDVGRDAEAEVLEVVAGVHDDDEVSDR